MDEIWKRDEVESPCVKLCVIHPEARRAVMAELPARAKGLTKRRGGRSGRAATST